MRSEDFHDLYAISRAAGYEGEVASHLYHDIQLMGHIYSVPYAILEPKLAMVVEDRQGISGFVVGRARYRKMGAFAGYRMVAFTSRTI